MRKRVMLRFLLNVFLVFVVIPVLWAYAWQLLNERCIIPFMHIMKPGTRFDHFAALFLEGVIMCLLGVSIMVGCGTSFSGLGDEILARVRYRHDKGEIVTVAEISQEGFKRPRGSLVGLVFIVTGVFMIIRVIFLF